MKRVRKVERIGKIRETKRIERKTRVEEAIAEIR